MRSRGALTALGVFVLGVIASACSSDDAPGSGVTIEMPASATTRPGKHLDIEAYVRGTTRWDTATCTVTGGTCTLHVIEPQHFRIDVLTPRMPGAITLTLDHDGSGGAPGTPAVPVSAVTEIMLEGRVVPPYLIPVTWQDSEHGSRVFDIEFSDDGERVASASAGVVKIHGWTSGRPLASLPVGYPESEVFVVDPSYPAESAAFTPGDASVLVGTYAYVMRLRDDKGDETGRVKLDDLPGNQAIPVVRDLSCHTGTGRCVAVRAPHEPCDDDDCYSGLYAIDDPRATTLSARSLVTSDRNEIWSRVALSPTGAQVAILQAPGNTIRVFDVVTGAEVQRIDDPPRSGIDWVHLEWTVDDRLVTSWSTFATSGARLGDGVIGPRAQALWRGQRRASMFSDVVEWGRMRFTDLPALTQRLSTGMSGGVSDFVVARDAPYLAVQVIDDGSSPVPGRGTLRVYDVRDGSVRRLIETPNETTFDMCVDGQLVFQGGDGRVYTASPADDFAPMPLADMTLGGSITALVTPPTGIPYDCRALVGAGLDQTAVVNVTDRVVEARLGFAAAHAALGGIEAEPYTLTHFFSPPTTFGAPPRILDATGALVAQPPNNVVKWSYGSGTVWLFDNTGQLTPWQLTTGTAGAGLAIASAALADRSFYLPRHRLGALMLATGAQLHIDPGASDHKIDLTHGVATPRLVIEAHDHVIIAGDSFILAHPSEAIQARVLELVDP